MSPQVRRFGTIGGVFLPSILSLFGVILFLRTGWVVGNAGFPNALLILLISAFIAFCTGLSVASISTNIEVGTGGTYYIISRSLGLDTGGAIGIPLYFSQAISISFYIIGFLESVSFIKPNVNFALWGTIILLFFSILVFTGADLAVRFQYVIAFILLLGIVSLVATPFRLPLAVNMHPHYSSGYDFWRVFAVFFPALVGIDAGIGLSGELREPGKNIPRGIVLALFCSVFVYGVVMFKAASLGNYIQLIKDTSIFVKTARFPYLVILGIWAATISSALTYSLTAPRTLKALAHDGVLPRFMASSLGSKRDEPRMGVIITFVIAEIFILTSSLNKVASVITMFFLISYGTLNLAAALETLVGGPCYRPRFKLPWYVSALGFLGASLAMFFIEPLSASFALLAIAITFTWLKRKNLTQTWGDVRKGMWIALARFGLLQLEKYDLDPASWRPNLMVFTGNPATRVHLTRFALWLSRGGGIVTLFNLMIPQRNSIETLCKRRYKMLQELKSFIKEQKMPLFAEVEIVKDPMEDIPLIVQAHGIGNLFSNVALFGWGHDPRRENLLMKIIRSLVLLDKDVIILKYDKNRGFGGFKKIDVWWGGKGGNIGLMLLIVEILKRNDEWKNAQVRVLKIIANPEREKLAHQAIEIALYKARLEADIKIIVEPQMNGKIPSIIEENSAEADLTVLGLPIPPKGEETAYADRVNSLIANLGTVLLVRSVTEKSFFA